MDRKTFFAITGAAALQGRALPSALSPQPLASIRPIGLQLYTVRNLLEHDFEGTLAQVAAVGYGEVELTDYFNHTATQVRAMLDRQHLVAIAQHIDYATLERQGDKAIADAHTLGLHYIVVAWIDEDRRRTLDGWRRVAEQLNHWGTAAKQSGLQLAYHNHSYEFERLEGRLPYDVLLESSDPALLKLEMDLYWITAGGQDPLAYFARYPGRIHLVHVKDMTADHKMADVGAGVIDWRRIFAHRGQAGIKHYFVEHDEPADAIQSITASFRYLSALRV